MTNRVRLVLAIHNHQPIGNFDGVFESAYQDSYAPFLDVLEDYPGIPIALHISGSLLEWLVEAHPEYIDRVRLLAERGQIEIVGGPFYESILAGIPSRDRIGQITLYSRYLEQLFGSRVRGMWVPERVWEQSFAGDITQAGIEYTILDDYHFRNAGLGEEDLFGYFLSEDEGRLLKIFPGSERLRYTIPFADPQVTIDYLKDIAERFPNSVVAFGDDGEKFGTWPETKKHVYEDGWLRRFFDALTSNSDWLRVCTFAEAVENVSPLGTIYLPDSSYREMTEWALPTGRQIEYSQLTKRRQSDPEWPLIKQFMRGGFWRNFRVKYPEANEMYSRMLQISSRLEAFATGAVKSDRPDLVNEARTELYRAQCNCSYWHGAFGGLYLPHLRNAVYAHLIAADNLLEAASARPARWVQVDADDFNLDIRKEIRLAGDRLIAFVAPAAGGQMYELDVRATKVNLLATLERRPEPYHDTVRQAASHQEHHDNGHVASIHDAVRFKQPDLDKKLIYDNWPHKSLVDHFLEPGLGINAYQAGTGELGDFVTGVYDSRLRRSANRVEVILTREGQAGPHRVVVEKSLSLDAERGGELEINYKLSKLPAGVPLHFGVEFNFASMAAGASDRYYYDAHGRQIGQLETIHALENTERVGLIDEWLGIDAAVESSVPADFWMFPVQTISQSEGGFELVHQSCAVVPHWQFRAGPDGTWGVRLTLSVDTSAAQARELTKAAVVG